MVRAASARMRKESAFLASANTFTAMPGHSKVLTVTLHQPQHLCLGHRCRQMHSQEWLCPCCPRAGELGAGCPGSQGGSTKPCISLLTAVLLRTEKLGSACLFLFFFSVWGAWNSMQARQIGWCFDNSPNVFAHPGVQCQRTKWQGQSWCDSTEVLSRVEGARAVVSYLCFFVDTGMGLSCPLKCTQGLFHRKLISCLYALDSQSVTSVWATRGRPLGPAQRFSWPRPVPFLLLLTLCRGRYQHAKLPVGFTPIPLQETSIPLSPDEPPRPKWQTE